jgi:hypothetical protein
MIKFKGIIEQFGAKGEKTNWTYILIPMDISEQLKPNVKVSFRVKGVLDQQAISGKALIPYGEGNYILVLNKPLIKCLKKGINDSVQLVLEEDKDFKLEIPEDLEFCLEDTENGIQNFYKLAPSHRKYFINWINEAKTESTRVKRLSQTVQAMELKMGYGEMIKFNRAKQN